MTEEDKDKARGLAVAYEAFWSAVKETETKSTDRVSWNAIAAWARMLQLAQYDCGVQLMADATLHTHIDRARRRMAELDVLALERIAEPVHVFETIVTNR